MDLSRRDAFRPCSRNSPEDKGQFCFLAKENCDYIGPPLPFLHVSQCNITTSKFFAFNYRPPLSSTHFLLKTFKFTIDIKVLLKSTTYYRNLQASPTYC